MDSTNGEHVPQQSFLELLTSDTLVPEVSTSNFPMEGSEEAGCQPVSYGWPHSAFAQPPLFTPSLSPPTLSPFAQAPALYAGPAPESPTVNSQVPAHPYQTRSVTRGSAGTSEQAVSLSASAEPGFQGMLGLSRSAAQSVQAATPGFEDVPPMPLQRVTNAPAASQPRRGRKPLTHPVRAIVCPVRAVVHTIRTVVHPIRAVIHPIRAIVRAIVCPVRTIVCPVRAIVCPVREIVCPVRVVVCPIRAVVRTVRTIIWPVLTALCFILTALHLVLVLTAPHIVLAFVHQHLPVPQKCSEDWSRSKRCRRQRPGWFKEGRLNYVS
ncbi:hypothetical protein BV20DRAFT_1052895 [Pilatotrama ljubarskyi]|nr:hypothetical protein BV20DRAFT_1052895 [Pilatotrama ljubarskyi]